MNVRLHTLDSFHNNRNFRLLWVSTLLVGCGFWFQILLVGWLTFHLTESPLLTSLALGLDGVVFLLAGPVGGTIGDLWNRRSLLVAVYAYQSVVTAVFALTAILDRTEVWHIFGYVLAMGLSWAVEHPTRSSIVPSIVSRRNMLNAFALLILAFTGPRLAVPILGGLLIVAIGPGRTMWLGSAMYLGASVTIMLLHTIRMSEDKTLHRLTPGQLVDGVRYVRTKPLVLAILILTGTLSFLFMPFIHGLMPVYASDIFDAGPAGLGLLISTMGVGATLCQIVLASVGDFRHKGRVLIFSFVLIIATMMSYSHSTSIESSIPSLFVLSIAVSTFFTMNVVVIQSVIPDNLRVRVMSLDSMTHGLFPVGSLLAGGLAQLLGAPGAILIAAGLMAVSALLILLKFRSVWNFE